MNRFVKGDKKTIDRLTQISGCVNRPRVPRNKMPKLLSLQTTRLSGFISGPDMRERKTNLTALQQRLAAIRSRMDQIDEDKRDSQHRPRASLLNCTSRVWLFVEDDRRASPSRSRNRAIDSLASVSSGIGIGGTVARPPLPHHRTCGSAYGGSAG